MTGESGAQWRSRLKTQFGELSDLQQIQDEEPAKVAEERHMKWEGIKEGGCPGSSERNCFKEEGGVITVKSQ